MFNTQYWPPQFAIRESSRARAVLFKVSLADGLIITIPKRFPKKNIPSILEQHKSWIIKQLSKVEAAKRESAILPTQLNFAGINLLYDINYLHRNGKPELKAIHPNKIILSANLDHSEDIKHCLVHWIKNQARLHLSTVLTSLSHKTHLSFSTVCIRAQRTRWGSCSAKKRINLNYKLIFLPPTLMEHVLIHELCHTVHLNHAKSFWALVAEHDPNWRAHVRNLRQANSHIPQWLSNT